MAAVSNVKRIYEEGVLVAKECSKCHGIKDVGEFSKDNRNKTDGLQSKCKQCEKQYRENNKKHIKERHKQYYKDNKESVKKRKKQYYEDNKEHIKEHSKQYYKENKEQYKKYSKQYRENNPEYNKQWYEDNKEHVKEHNKQWYEDNKEYMKEYHKQYREDNKERRKEYGKQYYDNKTLEAIREIYEKVTKKLYPHNGIQYGIIYGVYNTITDRWYIGQTTTSFDVRYNGNFFKYKVSEISEENSQLLVEDIETYGEGSFQIHEVLDVAFSEEELDALEVYYIDKYKAYDEGYNSNRGNINGKRSYREN